MKIFFAKINYLIFIIAKIQWNYVFCYIKLKLWQLRNTFIIQLAIGITFGIEKEKLIVKYFY